MRLINNPYLNAALALFVFASCVPELMDDIKALENAELDTHHGVIALAVLHFMRAMADIKESLEKAAEAHKSIHGD